MFPLENINVQNHEDAREVCQHLGESVTINIAPLDSYVHGLLWKWTNLAHEANISAALYMVECLESRYIDHILEEGRSAQGLVQEDRSPLTLVNQVRSRQLVFRTLVNYPPSFVLHNKQIGLVFNSIY